MVDFADLQFVETDEQRQETQVAEHQAKQARVAKLTKEANTELAKKLKQQEGVVLVFGATAPRVALVPKTQDEWNARLYSLLTIIRQPERVDKAYPLSNTWKELYPHIPYNGKATNWAISEKDTATIINLLKELGMYKRFSCSSVKNVIALVTDFRKTQIIKEQAAMIEEQSDKLKQYELLVDPESDSIWYKGHEIKRLSREYSVNVGGIKMTIPLKGIDKLFVICQHIDVAATLD